MDRITAMQVFVRVAELGSFAAAAKALDMSPTMAAKYVQAIEARMKAPLLHRTTRRHSLTEVGKLYLERSKALLADFEMAESTAHELQAAPRGLLRVTAPVVLGTHALAPLLPAFMARYPELRVELVLLDRVVDLMEDDFDVALRSGAVTDGGLVARPLPALQTVLCASPDYLRRRGVPRRPHDLAQHDCLGFAHWVHKDRWRLLGPDGEESVRIHSKLTINHGEALRQAALAGGGIVMQSDWLLADDLKSGALRRVLPRYTAPARPMGLVYRPDRRPAVKVQCLVEFVLASLRAPERKAAARRPQPEL